VLRLFRTELRYGFTDRPQFDPADSTYSVADRAVAFEGALESITLLKNEGNLLPLDPAKIKTIAIIGPNAWPAVTGGGGSSEARPSSRSASSPASPTCSAPMRTSSTAPACPTRRRKEGLSRMLTW
jgi:beta-glucosidase-like glycosyl hydrolase